jgi:Holliday junction resolvase
MPASSRQKGVVGEREVARIFQAAGFDVRGLEGLGDHLVVPGIALDRWTNRALTMHIEVKRQERLQLPIWLRQAADEAPQGALYVVAFRQNRGEWYAALPLAQLVELAT